MNRIKLRYINGHEEELQIDQQIRVWPGICVDLKGERSFLSQIEMFYGSRFGIDFGSGGIRINKPKVTVYGDNRGIGLPPRARVRRLAQAGMNLAVAASHVATIA